MDTIFALSSGAPPAGIAVVRVSGPQARLALEVLAGRVPSARRATRAWLKAADGSALDDGLILFFPGPATATGEDLAELHLHGGRAVVAAVEQELGSLAGFRRAQPGEFTRRAFANGRIDLAVAEGLADLLSAETELQRKLALANAGGFLSRKVEDWRDRLLSLSAGVEALLDFDDEGDVDSASSVQLQVGVGALADELKLALEAPAAEPLREGFRVALAGPPNAGKSTLFNALVECEAAITAPVAGTTRDVLVRPVAIGGVPFSFVDMAGLREGSNDAIEVAGIQRAGTEIARADLVLWLGPEGQGPAGGWEIDAQIDRPDHVAKCCPHYQLSAVTGQGMDALRQALADYARGRLPKPGDLALNLRQRTLLEQALDDLTVAQSEVDLLLLAEHLRRARLAFDSLQGRSSTEDVLDALFGQFCIGK